MRRTIQRPVSSRDRGTPVAVPVESALTKAVNAAHDSIADEPVEAKVYEDCPMPVLNPLTDPRMKTAGDVMAAIIDLNSTDTTVAIHKGIAATTGIQSTRIQPNHDGTVELAGSRPFAKAFEAAGVKSAAIIKEWADQHPELFPERQYTHYAHRSGHETWWACPRKYYLEYLHCGTGIRKMPTKLALTIGSAVHNGLATLLEGHKNAGQVTPDGLIQFAIKEALQYLEFSDTWQFLREPERVEQQTLIAGLLYAFYYYRWPSFSKQFEILTVERDWVERLPVSDTITLVTSSRPDAIVRDRNTNEIVVISWKTIDDIADYKRANFHQNLQTFLESFYGRKVLRRYLEEEYMPNVPDGLRGKALMEYLAAESERYKTLPAEIDYTLTIFLVKGPRTAKLLNGEDISLEEAGSYADQDRVYKQQSPLCYRWESLEESTLCGQAWTQRYYKEGNVSYNNIGKDFLSTPVPFDQVEEWVRSLNNGEVFPSVLVDSRNLTNPLQKVIVDEEPEYWDGERAEEAMESFKQDSVEIAIHNECLKLDGEANPEKPFEQLLGVYFKKHLTSCNNSAPSAGFPVKCEYKEMCVGSEQLVQIAPNANQEGIWTRRLPHHHAELEGWKEEKHDR